MAEKILSRHSGRDVHAGEITVADLDFVMGQDGTSPLAIRAFHQMNGSRVFDPARVALVIDHSAPSPLEGVSALHKSMREFTAKQSVKLFDIGEGVCHQLIPEKGYVGPGCLVVGADSHTCTYGALNAFSTGVGSTDLAAAMISGKLWFKVPETFRFQCHGRLPKGVYAKDLILYLIGRVGAEGASYMAAEYVGEAISELSIAGRFTIANMAIEMGAKAGLMECDEKTAAWAAAHSTRAYAPVTSDPDAAAAKELEVDVSALEPQIAKPHTVDNVVPLAAVSNVEIQQVFIGTCTNGRLEDLSTAAEILEGRRVKKGVRLIVAPASRQVMLDALESGVLRILIEAGAAVVTPGCGPCVGTHNGVPSDGENVLSTANRNFKGRMGNSKAFIYLGSPAAAAATAITGRITDPREFLK